MTLAETAEKVPADDLEAELEADQRGHGSRCGTCRWLGNQPPAEQSRWDELMARREPNGELAFNDASFARAFTRRGHPVSDTAVRHHRAQGHRR